MKKMIAAAVLATIPMLCIAEDGVLGRASFYNGNQYLQLQETEQLAYLMGAVDGLSEASLRPACLHMGMMVSE